MSYSFGVRAATKPAAKAELASKFDELVTKGQPAHEFDKAQALAAGNAFIDLLPDDESKDVSFSIHGSLSGRWEGAKLVEITGASVGVSASLIPKA